MAMRLLYSTRTLDRDANLQRRGGVTYYAVGATSPAAAIAMWDADADGTNKVHPDDPTMPFDGISVAPLPNGAGYNVTARFSTDKSGRFNPGPPVNEPGWHAWERGKRRGEAFLAVNLRVWIMPDQNSTSPIEVWRLSKWGVDEYYPRRTLRFRVTTVNQSIFDVLDESIGDVHRMPNNEYWQFIDSDTKPVDATTWEVMLTWERDRGTPVPQPSFGARFQMAAYDASAIPSDLRTVQTITYRPPYCKVAEELVSADPRTTPHTVIMAFSGRLNPDGWQSFPGSELI